MSLSTIDNDPTGKKDFESNNHLPSLAMALSMYYPLNRRDFIKHQHDLGNSSFDADDYNDYLSANHDLLRPLGTALDDIPAMTVCVPIAIDEGMGNIAATLRQITKSAKNLEGSAEVILWVNHNYSAPDVEHGFDEILSLANLHTNGKVHFSAALDIIPDDARTMSRIRTDMMNALIVRAEQNDYPVNHPVLWLDADTTFIAKNAFSKICEDASSCPVPAFHQPQLNWSADWIDPTVPLDTATKAFIVDELQRRAEAKSVEKMRGSYLEEPGMFFPLDAYILAGGCDLEYDVEESHGLIHGLNTIPMSKLVSEYYADRYAALSDNRRGHNSFGHPTRKLSPDIRIHTSGRRIREELGRYGLAALGDRSAGYPGSDPNQEYRLFTDYLRMPKETRRLSAWRAKRHLKAKNQQLPPEDAARIAKTIDKMF